MSSAFISGAQRIFLCGWRGSRVGHNFLRHVDGYFTETHDVCLVFIIQVLTSNTAVVYCTEAQIMSLWGRKECTVRDTVTWGSWMVYLSLFSRMRSLELLQTKLGGGAARTRHTSRPVPPTSAQDARNLLMSWAIVTASVSANTEHKTRR